MTPTTKATKKNRIPACPACSHTLGSSVEGRPLVYVCGDCQAIFSDHLYLGQSYELVLPQMTAEEVPAEFQRYFDFTCLSSKGTVRRHGWYDIRTRLITQVG